MLGGFCAFAVQNSCTLVRRPIAHANRPKENALLCVSVSLCLCGESRSQPLEQDAGGDGDVEGLDLAVEGDGDLTG